MTGTVLHINASGGDGAGYGFVACKGVKRLYFSFEQVRLGYRATLAVGAEVQFAVATGPGGTPIAVDVRTVNAVSSPRDQNVAAFVASSASATAMGEAMRRASS